MVTQRFRGRTVIDNLYAAVASGRLAGIGGVKGFHYYVDPTNGSDGNSGKTPQRAYATMAKALSKCVAYRGDVIHRMKGTETVTSEVEIDCHGVTIIADQLFNPMGNGEAFTTYGSHIDGPAAILKAPAILVGLGFVGSQPAGPSLLIDCEEAGGYEGGFNWLLGCRFSQWGIAKAYALKTLGGAVNLIEGCIFDGLFAGYTTAAISLHNDTGGLAPYNTWLKDNIFSAIGTGKYCIEFATGSVPNGLLISGNINTRNVLEGASQQAKFINSNAVTGSGHIFDNYPGFATDTGSYDRTVAQLQAQGFLLSNNHYSE